MDPFQFLFFKPSLWLGRQPPAHGRGLESSLALRPGSRGFWPVLEWRQANQNALRFEALSSVPLYSLTDSLLETYQALQQTLHGRQTPREDLGGFPFFLNEFGQVLVPLDGAEGKAAAWGLAGETQGRLLFAGAAGTGQNVRVIDLAEDAHLSPGDEWVLPVLGTPYYLSRRTHVYFQHADGRQEEPQEQDWELCDALRDFYPSGPVRFLVNPYGLVLAPKPEPENWIYVGKIRKEYWFEKEEG